jgi:hypothetical protein
MGIEVQAKEETFIKSLKAGTTEACLLPSVELNAKRKITRADPQTLSPD